MGKYSLEEIERHIEDCLGFLRSYAYDVYTRAFWLCSLWMYLAAKKAGTGIVNNSTTRDMYSELVYKYRNSYAHNESLESLHDTLKWLIDSVSDDWFVYSEIDSSVKEIRGFLLVNFMMCNCFTPIKLEV